MILHLKKKTEQNSLYMKATKLLGVQSTEYLLLANVIGKIKMK